MKLRIVKTVEADDFDGAESTVYRVDKKTFVFWKSVFSTPDEYIANNYVDRAVEKSMGVNPPEVIREVEL